MRTDDGGDLTSDPRLPAGDFSSWLAAVQRALDGEAGSDVPCAGCTACCRSSQFVHIEPDETETLARIPSELLFPAPRRPRGHVLLGYDQRGHCPMLLDDRCSIYEDRPRTCRTYDCRVLPAAGVELDDEEQLPVARRARQWEFSHPDESDTARHDAVRAAARFVREHRGLLPDGVAPANGTQRAVLAVRLHDVFLRRDEATGREVVADPAPEAVRVVLTTRLGHRAGG